MIELMNIRKKFDGNEVLRNVSVKVKKGETLAIIGKSGCGKSVLLKIIVALLRPDEGKVFIDGKNILEARDNELYEIRKKFGFLFQNAALFDSLSIEENIALPLIENENHNYTKKELAKIVEEKLELVGLSGIEKLKPSELSGGMQKRVGLARALVANPEYVLYDEPTTGLDPTMSDTIDALIKELNGMLGVTSVLVTHDMKSVENVADRVAMLHEGEIYFTGTFEEIMTSEDKIIREFVKRLQ